MELLSHIIIRGKTAAAANSYDIYYLLVDVLPTFIFLAKRVHDSFQSPGIEIDTTEIEDFYVKFYTSASLLKAALTHCDPLEVVRGRPSDEAQVLASLHLILHKLENCFLSQQRFQSDFDKLDLRVQKDVEKYPKLNALQRILPSKGDLDEGSMDYIHHIIRIDKTSRKKREILLSSLTQAFGLIDKLVLSGERSDSPCPYPFLDSPLRPVRNLAEVLFETIQKHWCCSCPHSPYHVERKARLNLTRHQQFEMAPARDGNTVTKEVRFRVLFPANTMELKWQTTEIAVLTHECRDDIYGCEVERGICGIIHAVKRGDLPQMIISRKRLWQLGSVTERAQYSNPQIMDTDFRSLEGLLRPRQGNGAFSSWTTPTERMILSFILTTFLLHSIGGPWLQDNFSSANISFFAPNQGSRLDITKPHFMSNCLRKTEAISADFSQSHRFPDILSLGIILLEIAQGYPIEFLQSDSRCGVALKCMDRWEEDRRRSPLPPGPEGLHLAIKACLDRREFTEGQFRTKHVNPFVLRKYIFDRILYPLGDALVTAYEIQLGSLHESRGTGPKDAGSFDHKDETQEQRLKDANEWWGHLNGIHDLFYTCQERYVDRSANEKDVYVKVAVLDTGLQLDKASHQNFEEAGKIDPYQSKDFVAPTEAEATSGWKEDDDGHGSRIGRILLDVAPGIVLHTAKVFKNKNDLGSPDLANQVHDRIAKAIECATQEWQVDIIVMCFGFDNPIALIERAIEKALRSERPPLLFAATRNEAAHKPMAWPANDRSVIGISSTSGSGKLSEFNPPAGSQDSILYAFGEGVGVQTAAGNQPVSGTSYATAVAAGLAANLLGCVRMIVDTSSSEDQATYQQVPKDLQRMNGMLSVLKCRMQGKDVCGHKSLLPWHFLKEGMLDKNRILREVKDTLQKECTCDICR